MNLKNYKYFLLFYLAISISCKNNRQEPFTFIQLCDTQLGMGGYNHDIKTFTQAVKQINKLNPDFVIICGDLVDHANDSSYTDFKKIKNQFKMTCYSAPGNHDVGNLPTDSTLLFYRKNIGQDYYTFQNKGVSFIISNSQLWKKNVVFESQKQDKWIKETLKDLKQTGQPIIIAGHYPLFLKTPDEKEVYFNLPVVKRKELLDLFSKNNVAAYISGHAHRPILNKYKDIQLVSGEATSKNLDTISDLGFRVWNVSQDTIKQHFVSLEAPLNESP